jgi:hypothetical protein
MNALDADSQLGFLGAVNAGRSFVLVWGNPDDPDTPEVTFEDASQCIVVYCPGSRRHRRAALKRWEDGTDDYATLYLPNEVWKFKRGRLGMYQKTPYMQEADDEMNGWAVRDMGDEPNPQPNPLGVVPMVELPNRPTMVSDPISRYVRGHCATGRRKPALGTAIHGQRLRIVPDPHCAGR